MYYAIRDKLTEITQAECLSGKDKYVVLLSAQQWAEQKEQFDLVMDLELEMELDANKIEVNYDSLTGNFSIPDKKNLEAKQSQFAFALDEKGIIFIDDSGYVLKALQNISRTKKWRFPSLERFIYDFLETTVAQDLKLLANYETRLEKIEACVLENHMDGAIEDMNDIRSDLLELRSFYEQLIDMGQELEENENDFFAEDNLRFFHMFTRRVERYKDQVVALREYSMQIRDLHQTQTDVHQNKIMAVLTIITTIFFPLSIITGWYGMNFAFMPELDFKWAYPILVGICIIIISVELLIFKIKKWL